jgi:hypothetical protein
MYSFKRFNAIGLIYFIVEDGEKTRIVCRNKAIIVDQSIGVISQCWYNWQMKGAAIQEAFACLSAEEREFLLTGITPQEWKELFVDPDSDSNADNK